MSLKSKSAIGFVAVLFMLLAQPIAGDDIEALLPGIVKISTTRNGSTVTGTGFVISLESEAAYVMTAAHVIAGGEETQVTFYQEPRSLGAAGTWIDEASDLAALWVPGVPASTVPLSLSARSKMPFGARLQWVGLSRQARAPRVVTGSMSGLEGSRWIFEPGAREGDSGGPLLRAGQVVGVVTEAESQRFTLVVPVATVQQVLEAWGIPFDLAPPGATALKPEDEAAQTHELLVMLPSAMENAEILVDGHPPVIVRDLGIFVTIRVTAKDSNHRIEVRKGERVCWQEIWIGADTSRTYPCD